MIDIKSLIAKEIEAIENIPIDESAINQAVDLIYSCVHQNNGKVVVSGMGKAGQVGVTIGTTLSSTGTPAVFLHPSEAQHGDLGLIQKNDVLLLISNSGKTREILEMVQLVKNLYPTIKIIGMTGNINGELTPLIDICIDTGNPQEICPLGLTPTTSTTTLAVMGDILVVVLMDKIKFTKEQYAKRHHSGYLGVKARGKG